MSEEIFGCHTGGRGGCVLLASSGWKLEILLKTLKCTGRPSPHTHRNDPAQDVNSAEAVKPIWK